MRLFLCSHFSNVGHLVKNEIANKKIAFIKTAAVNQWYTGHVSSARRLFKKMGAEVNEIDISSEKYAKIEAIFKAADVIYFTGGNSFFLIDQLRRTGVDKLLKEELEKGKLMIGESAGAIVCAPTVSYIERIDKRPADYSQKDDNGLNLIDYYILPHYLTIPFKKATEQIFDNYHDLDIRPINNKQAIIVDNQFSMVVNSK